MTSEGASSQEEAGDLPDVDNSDLDELREQITELQEQIEGFQHLLRGLDRWRRARTYLNRDPLELQISEENLLNELAAWDLSR